MDCVSLRLSRRSSKATANTAGSTSRRDSKEVHMKQRPSGKIARRGWMKTAAAVVGGTAASTVLPSMESRVEAATLTKSGISASPLSLVVETTAGKIHGFSSDGILAFKGVPYAGDTSGKN